MRILITGSTGYLGKTIIDKLLEKRENYIVGTYNSENRYAMTKSYIGHDKIKNNNIFFEHLNLSDDKVEEYVDDIIKKHNIEYIIHTAAIKHVATCEENKKLAEKVNFFATCKIVDAAKKNNVKNLIAVSTDKSINPTSYYGMTKERMDKYVLKNNYSVYKGVNFFGSSGSVVDMWYTRMLINKPLYICRGGYKRYFNNVWEVAECIIENLSNTTSRQILPDCAYLIQIEALLDAFCKYFNYSYV